MERTTDRRKKSRGDIWTGGRDWLRAQSWSDHSIHACINRSAGPIQSAQESESCRLVVVVGWRRCLVPAWRASRFDPMSD